MIGISKKELEDMLRAEGRLDIKIALNFIIQQCQELQEPWITLEEFLKSGFVGECWIIYCGDVERAHFINSFYKRIDSAWCFHQKQITNVMPIHKPEPPR